MIELRSGTEAAAGTWPDDQLQPALEAFWRRVLDPHASWSTWRLVVPGRPALELPRDLDLRVLTTLGQRQLEEGFLEGLVRGVVPGGPLELGPVLALPPRLPARVEQVVQVLRRALELSQPLLHLGRIAHTLHRAPDAAFCLATRSSGELREWQLDVHQPSRLRVVLEARGETTWSFELQHRGGTPVAALLDAFQERGLEVREKVAWLEPGLVKVLPFTDENLRGVLPPLRKAASECSVCSAIGVYASRTVKGGVEFGTTPKEVSGLREFMRLGENVASSWLERCSECDGLYYAERSHEYLVDGSEDSESWRRHTADEVLREVPEVSWARQPGVELHGFDDGTWAIITEPAKHLPQRRS